MVVGSACCINELLERSQGTYREDRTEILRRRRSDRKVSDQEQSAHEDTFAFQITLITIIITKRLYQEEIS